MSRRSGHDESGAATVMTAPFVGILVLVVALLAFQGGIVVAQRKVQAAADLAALAAAAAGQRGRDACAAAAAFATDNSARLTGCRLGGPGGAEVLVTVDRAGPALLGREVTVRASARAGPGPP